MNAKQEFLNHIGNSVVLCAIIKIGDDHHGTQFIDTHLTTGYTNEEWEKFLSDIDVEYDSGYGGQELFGTIWFTDGTWSQRGEYDGSEWWEHYILPDIPKKLKRIDKERDIKIDKILTDD